MQENNTKSDDLFTLFHICDAVNKGREKAVKLRNKRTVCKALR